MHSQVRSQAARYESLEGEKSRLLAEQGASSDARWELVSLRGAHSLTPPPRTHSHRRALASIHASAAAARARLHR